MLTVEGAVYTTATGANITSSKGTGKYAQVSAPGTSNKTYQFNQNSKEYIGVDITAAKLHNADGTYTETANASAGKTFTYCTCTECNGKWEQNAAAIIKNDGTRTKTCKTLKEAVDNLEAGQYIKMLHSTTEDITTENSTTGKDLYLDLNGCTVKGDITVKSGYKLYGMDSSAKADYTTAPTGKIVGKVTGTVAPTYQTPGDTNDRYVAIPGTEADGNTPNLSFHHFNISVTGYHFELTTGGTPQCALFFIGKFQGDDAAKSHLTSLGFTLTDIDGTTSKTVSCEMPKSLKDGAEGENSTVISEDGAYLFEAYLMREIDKSNPDTYRKPFSATAQATFDNGGKQSDPRELSFWDAWTETDGLKDLTPKQQKILKNFLDGLDTPNQTE